MHEQLLWNGDTDMKLEGLHHLTMIKSTRDKAVSVCNKGGEVLIAQKTGAPGAIPTRDLPLRRRTLYAAELREHKG